MIKKPRSETKLRYLIAHETAKIMAEEGIKDYRLAKSKAANRLGQSLQTCLPSNSEVEAALLEYQRLFKANSHPSELHQVRKKTIQVLSLLKEFNPHLVGPVLTGLYTPHLEVYLHLYAATVEDVMFFLMDQGITFKNRERRYRFQNNTYEYHPVLLCNIDDTEFDITVFTVRRIDEVAYSQITGKPMPRATRGELEELLRHTVSKAL